MGVGLFRSPFPTSVPASVIPFFPILISRLNKENLETKQRKLLISRKLCWRLVLGDLGCSKKITETYVDT